MTDKVNKIDFIPNDVPMEHGQTMGWGSVRGSSMKNTIFVKNKNDLPLNMKNLFMKVFMGKTHTNFFRGLVNEDETNLLWGYEPNCNAHTSVVNNLMNFTTYNLIYLEIFNQKIETH